MKNNNIAEKESHPDFERLDFLLTLNKGGAFKVYIDVTTLQLYFLGDNVAEKIPKDTTVICVYRSAATEKSTSETVEIVKNRTQDVAEWLAKTESLLIAADVYGYLNSNEAPITRRKAFKMAVKGLVLAEKVLMGDYV